MLDQAPAACVYAAGSLCALRTWRFSFKQRSDSVSSFAFTRKASSPPVRSTDFKAWALTRSRTRRWSASLISVTSTRFGLNTRLVLFSAWLRSWPDIGPLPVSSQRRVILETSSKKAHLGAGLYLAAVLYEMPVASRLCAGRRCPLRVFFSDSETACARHRIDANPASVPAENAGDRAASPKAC